MIQAEVNDKKIRESVQLAKGGILHAAALLIKHQQNKWWAIGDLYPSFKDYIDSLGGHTYTYMTRLMNVVKAITAEDLTAEEVDEMGLANAITLLPLIRDHELTPEIKQAALTSSTRELRAMLGGEQKEKASSSLTCPGCGMDIRGAKWE
uniref:Uncharacterized protein n=1 Tax=viral metagenome TaxID=1070528 RepID=A0A6M3XSB2_9ZZZZ